MITSQNDSCESLTQHLIFKYEKNNKQQVFRGFIISLTIFVFFHILILLPTFVKGEPLLTESLEKKSYFESILKPYTHMSVIDPVLATTAYMKSRQLSDAERIAFRHFIDDYIDFHVANRQVGNRYLIFCAWGNGGLGDRARHLINALWLAVVTKRVFLVDWNSPFSLSLFLSNARSDLNLFYDEINDSKRGITARILNDKTIPRLPYIQFLNASIHNKTSEIEDEEILMSNVPTVVFKWNRLPNEPSNKLLDFNRPKNLPRQIMHNMLANQRYHRVIFHRIFRLSKIVQTQFTNASKHLDILNKPYISVHARIGEGVKEGESSRFRVIMNAQDKAALCLAKRALSLSRGWDMNSNPKQEPRLDIFLATDSPGFRKLFIKTVNQLTGGKVRVLYGDWDVIHTKMLYGRTDDYKEQAVFGGVLDLAILGQAQHIVALYSSFATLAHLIGISETMTELKNEKCVEEEDASHLVGLTRF